VTTYVSNNAAAGAWLTGSYKHDLQTSKKSFAESLTIEQELGSLALTNKQEEFP